MTAAITTRNVSDATGSLLIPLQVIDQSGNGSGPFQFAHIAQTEGWRATFSLAVFGITPAATPSDLFTMVPTTKRCRILRIGIGGVATAAGSLPFQLIRRSTANTSGTAVALTAGAHEAADGSATMGVNRYSANPTTGTTAAIHRASRLFLNLATAGTDRLAWDFTRDNGKGLVLASSTDFLAVNCNGAALPTGTAIDFDVTWAEDPV